MPLIDCHCYRMEDGLQVSEAYEIVVDIPNMSVTFEPHAPDIPSSSSIDRQGESGQQPATTTPKATVVTSAAAAALVTKPAVKSKLSQSRARFKLWHVDLHLSP